MRCLPPDMDTDWPLGFAELEKVVYTFFTPIFLAEKEN